MDKKFTRREMLGLGAVAGAAVLGTANKPVTPPPVVKPVSGLAIPWKYSVLDVEKTKARAYRNYFKGGCMYGVFEAVAAQVAESLGKPYTDFPFSLSTYGGGGVALWGTLCGTCNGAAMAMAMFQAGKVRNQLINEIFTWYETTTLPLFVPEKPRKVKEGFQIKGSEAGSTLCHVSITRWTEGAGCESFSPERVERCARLVADMAGHTAQLLNEVAQAKFVPKNQISATANGCLACHAKGKQAPNEPEVVSKMSCTACHGDPHKEKNK